MLNKNNINHKNDKNDNYLYYREKGTWRKLKA